MILSSEALFTWRFPSIFVTGIVPRWIRCSIALGERPMYSAASARVKRRFAAGTGAAIRLASASASLEMNCSSNTVQLLEHMHEAHRCVSLHPGPRVAGSGLESEPACFYFRHVCSSHNNRHLCFEPQKLMNDFRFPTVDTVRTLSSS